MTIEIHDLTFDCIIGILDFERTKPQKVMVDAVISYDYAPGSFLDYAAVAAHIETMMREKKFELIETALLHLAETLTKQFPAIKTVEITISKPDILPNCRVSVAIKSEY